MLDLHCKSALGRPCKFYTLMRIQRLTKYKALLLFRKWSLNCHNLSAVKILISQLIFVFGPGQTKNVLIFWTEIDIYSQLNLSKISLRSWIFLVYWIPNFVYLLLFCSNKSGLLYYYGDMVSGTKWLNRNWHRGSIWLNDLIVLKQCLITLSHNYTPLFILLTCYWVGINKY